MRFYRKENILIFLKSFCKCQLPHKSVNISSIITYIKSKLTDLCGNRLLQNDLKIAFCEISLDTMTAPTLLTKHFTLLVRKYTGLSTPPTPRLHTVHHFRFAAMWQHFRTISFFCLSLSLFLNLLRLSVSLFFSLFSLCLST